MTTPGQVRQSFRAGPTRLLGLAQAACGVWLLALPFVFDLPRDHPHEYPFWNALATGALVLMLGAALSLNGEGMRAASRINLWLGMWFVASPGVFGYSKYLNNGGAVVAASVVTGLVLVALSAFALARSRPEVSDPLSATAIDERNSRPVLSPDGPPRPPAPASPGRGSGTDAKPVVRSWLAVASLVAAAISAGLWVIAPSWWLAGAAVVLLAVGVALAVSGRIMADVTTSTSPTGR